MQYRISRNRFQNFINTSGIYGKTINRLSSVLATAFVSFPLHSDANINGLFNTFKNPFNDFTPLLFQRFQLQNQNYLNPRLFLNDSSRNQFCFVGGKIVMFNSLTSFIGIRPYMEVILNKPKDFETNVLTNFGFGMDFNIFSRLIFSLIAESNVSNRFRPKYYYKIGFLFNVI